MRRGEGGGGAAALADWLDLGHMESRLHPHGPGELEPDCHRIDDLFNGEGSNEFGSQFVRLYLQRKVVGGESDFLAHLILWSLRATMVGCSGVSISCLQEGGPSSGPGQTTVVEEGLN